MATVAVEALIALARRRSVEEVAVRFARLGRERAASASSDTRRLPTRRPPASRPTGTPSMATALRPPLTTASLPTRSMAAQARPRGIEVAAARAMPVPMARALMPQPAPPRPAARDPAFAAPVQGRPVTATSQSGVRPVPNTEALQRSSPRIDPPNGLRRTDDARSNAPARPASRTVHDAFAKARDRALATPDRLPQMMTGTRRGGSRSMTMIPTAGGAAGSTQPTRMRDPVRPPLPTDKTGPSGTIGRPTSAPPPPSMMSGGTTPDRMSGAVAPSSGASAQGPSGHPTAPSIDLARPGPSQAAASSAPSSAPSAPSAPGSGTVVLAGDFLVDGRALGQVTSAHQARALTASPTGTRALNLRATPVANGHIIAVP